MPHSYVVYDFVPGHPGSSLTPVLTVHKCTAFCERSTTVSDMYENYPWPDMIE
jgi:hypothetical protein